MEGNKVLRRPNNLLTDGGEVVGLTRQWAALYPQDDSWYSFLLEAEPGSYERCVTAVQC
jgi:hypothetical protein